MVTFILQLSGNLRWLQILSSATTTKKSQNSNLLGVYFPLFYKYSHKQKQTLLPESPKERKYKVTAIMHSIYSILNYKNTADAQLSNTYSKLKKCRRRTCVQETRVQTILNHNGCNYDSVTLNPRDSQHLKNSWQLKLQQAGRLILLSLQQALLQASLGLLLILSIEPYLIEPSKFPQKRNP